MKLKLKKRLTLKRKLPTIPYTQVTVSGYYWGKFQNNQLPPEIYAIWLDVDSGEVHSVRVFTGRRLTPEQINKLHVWPEPIKPEYTGEYIP